MFYKLEYINIYCSATLPYASLIECELLTASVFVNNIAGNYDVEWMFPRWNSVGD